MTQALEPVENMVSGVQQAASGLFQFIYAEALGARLTPQTLAKKIGQFATNVGIFGGPTNPFKGTTKSGKPVTRHYGRTELYEFGEKLGLRIALRASQMGEAHMFQRIEVTQRMIRRGIVITE